MLTHILAYTTVSRTYHTEKALSSKNGLPVRLLPQSWGCVLQDARASYATL